MILVIGICDETWAKSSSAFGATWCEVDWEHPLWIETAVAREFLVFVVETFGFRAHVPSMTKLIRQSVLKFEYCFTVIVIFKFSLRVHLLEYEALLAIIG